MKNVGIQHACSEDWNQMTPTEKGAFCQKCVKQVYDFTNKSTTEIKHTLLELRGTEICGRLTIEQELSLNAEFDAWVQANKTNFQRLFITALLIVFGLALFSCEDERDQRHLEKARTELGRIVEEKHPPKEEKEEIREEIKKEIPVPEAIPMPYPVYEMIDVKGEEELENVEIIAYEQNYVTSGIMVSTTYYTDFLEETTEVETDENGVPYPTEFKASVFPNPAVESTTLEIQAPEKERMTIELYDTSGKLIREIHSGKISRGIFQQVIDLNDLTSGIYLIIIKSKAFTETVRCVKN